VNTKRKNKVCKAKKRRVEDLFKGRFAPKKSSEGTGSPQVYCGLVDEKKKCRQNVVSAETKKMVTGCWGHCGREFWYFYVCGKSESAIQIGGECRGRRLFGRCPQKNAGPRYGLMKQPGGAKP